MTVHEIVAGAGIESLVQSEDFRQRHTGPSAEEVSEMLSQLGVSDLDGLVAATMPASIRLKDPLDLPVGCSEREALAELREMGAANEVFKSYIGMGYYGTHTPTVILRNVLENPGWYTAYTPYQAEIAQGRLESLLNFQQMVMDLTGMEMANASLLDEGTAAAEAMALAKRASKHSSNLFFVADDVFPQTLDVIQTRARYYGFEVEIGPAETAANFDLFGALFQYPGGLGEVRDLTDVITAVP